MGVMRFLIPRVDPQTDWPEAGRGYVTSLDGRVHATRIEWEGDVLLCRRGASDSVKFHVPWPVAGYGRPVVTTTSLPEREHPYLLPLELVRGKISEIREQCASWEQLRMVIPEEYQQAERRAFRAFTQAMTAHDDPVRLHELTAVALQNAFVAAQSLAESYTAQRLSSQRYSASHPPSLLGCTLNASVSEQSPTPEFCDAFNSAVVPIEWRRVEPKEGEYHWADLDALIDRCIEQRMMIRGGPLIDLSSQGMPRWLSQWEHDFLNLQSFVCDFVDTAVTRYTGKIRTWEVSAHGNSGGALGLGEEHRLALVARTLETALRTDRESQFFIRIDQPWGEYQARGQHRLSPFQFVDALVRSNLGLSGVNLEIAVGYAPSGSLSRDSLSFSRLIDHWSMLGVQLHVTLAFPANDAPDPQVLSDLVVGRPVWREEWSDDLQAAWLETFVPLLMAKPIVTGVYWSHFHDGQPHVFPNAGLLRSDGSPRPALDVLSRQRGQGR